LECKKLLDSLQWQEPNSKEIFNKYNKQAQQGAAVVDERVMEKQSTVGKITALKYFFLQLMVTQSDVQMAYYANKALSASFPQIAMFKLYKNYLSIFAVSSALQLHDSFTLEAYLEDFNQNYGLTAGKSAKLAEAVAEFNLYNNWQTLVSMRLFLMYLTMYESSVTSQMMYSAQTTQTTQGTNSTGQSFLETEAEPFVGAGQNPQAMYMQYMYMVYFSSILKYYCLFTELSIPQYGSMMASMKLRGLSILQDPSVLDKQAAHTLVSQSEYLDDVVVPGAISQWSNLVLTRYYIEFYVLMFEMYLPTLAAQRMYTRADSAMLNTNLLQTEQPKLQQ